MKCTRQNFMNFYFCGSGRSNWQLFYLTHILCSCTLQYEFEDALDDFGVQEIVVGSDAGSETVLGQIFASTNFYGMGFIREYSENLHIAKKVFIRYKYIPL